MNHSPNKKRVIFFTILFVLIAFLIVFFSQRRAQNDYNTIENPSRANNLDFETNSIEALPAAGVSVSTPVSTPRLKVKTIQEDKITPIKNIDKKIIKTGTVEMRVNSVDQAIVNIKNIAQQNGGDEISSDFSKTDTYKQGYINIKVPIDQYDNTFSQIKNIAPLIIHESSQSQDVTSEFIDLDSRIKNKKKHEEQLRSLFEKADKVDDLLKIERELTRVHTEIEQMEGQMKYLKDKTQYSTINVTLYENADIVVSDSWRPIQVAKDSFGTLVHKTTNLINTSIRFIIISLPFILLSIIIIWISYFILKRLFKKNN